MPKKIDALLHRIQKSLIEPLQKTCWLHGWIYLVESTSWILLLPSFANYGSWKMSARNLSFSHRKLRPISYLLFFLNYMIIIVTWWRWCCTWAPSLSYIFFLMLFSKLTTQSWFFFKGNFQLFLCLQSLFWFIEEVPGKIRCVDWFVNCKSNFFVFSVFGLDKTTLGD